MIRSAKFRTACEIGAYVGNQPIVYRSLHEERLVHGIAKACLTVLTSEWMTTKEILLALRATGHQGAQQWSLQITGSAMNYAVTRFKVDYAYRSLDGKSLNKLRSCYRLRSVVE